MKPARSSANRCFRSATTRRSQPRSRRMSHERSRDRSLAGLTGCSIGSRRSPISSRCSTSSATDVAYRRRDRDGADLRVLARADHHQSAADQAGQGPADPRRRPGLAPAHQEGHADHGRADDPVGGARSTLLWAQPHQRLCLDRAQRDPRLRADRLLRRLSQGDEADARRLLRPRAPADRGAGRRARPATRSRPSASSRSRPRSRFRSSRS